MNMTKPKKTEQELRTLLQDAKLIHDFLHIGRMGRKMRDKIFKAKDGTIVAEIFDSLNRREPFPLIELDDRQYRATVEINTWMPDVCTAEGKIKAAKNLRRCLKYSKTTCENNERQINQTSNHNDPYSL